MSSGQTNLIEETLKPLFEKKEELEAELQDIIAQAEVKKDEIKTIDKLLRAGGLLETAPKKARGSGPQWGISDKQRNKAIKIIQNLEKQGKEEWSQSDLIDNGVSRGSVSSITRIFQQEGIIRLTGAKHPKGTTRGLKTRHYKLIEGAVDNA